MLHNGAHRNCRTVSLMAQDRAPSRWELDNPWEASLARNIGRAITDARRRHGFSQEELAGELGISRNSVANYEVGRGIPRLGLLLQIAAVLNTAPAVLMYPNPSDELSNTVEVVPGVEETGFQAVQWFSGLGPGISDATASGAAAAGAARAEYRANTHVLSLWRKIAELRDRQMQHSHTGPNGKLTSAQLELVEQYQAQIDQVRRELGLADDA